MSDHASSSHANPDEDRTQATQGSGVFSRGGWDSGTSSESEMLPPDECEAHDVAEAFRRWGVDVWRLLRSVGVPERVAFDAVQDVFLAAHQRWNAYLGMSSRKTWIFGIALNVARNYRRRHARCAEDDALVGDDELLNAFSKGTADPWEDLCRSESLRLLDRLLSSVDEPERQLFVLVAVHDLTVTESAKLVGLVESKARARLAAVRARLSAELVRLRAKDEWRLR